MKKKSLQSGFSLIELMVSLSLFIIVVLAAVSSLYAVNNAARKVESMRNVLDNLNFAMESMSRNIRTSYDISCSSDLTNPNCPVSVGSGSGAISFWSTLGLIDPENIQYRLSNGAIQKEISGKIVNITSPEITITNLKFFVEGANPTNTTDGKQPSVTIFVEGVAQAGTDNLVPFAIQTLVSQRRVE